MTDPKKPKVPAAINPASLLPPPTVPAVPVPGPGGAVGTVIGILGGLVEAFTAAARELEALRADMEKRPTIDGSRSDAVAAELDGDMAPDGNGK